MASLTAAKQGDTGRHSPSLEPNEEKNVIFFFRFTFFLNFPFVGMSREEGGNESYLADSV